MKFSKRLAAILLAMMMVITLAACGDGDSGSTADTTEPAAGGDDASTDGDTDTNDGDDDVATAPVNSDMNIDVFIYDYADTYIASVRSSMEDQFQAAGLNATFYDGGSDQATQTGQIETALTQGSDLLIVNIVTTGSEDAAMNIVDQAKDKGVPIIFFNREVSDEVVNSYDKCVFVGTDADEAGVMQGEMIADIIGGNIEQYDLNGDGQISYIMFKGELGNAEADGRTQYSVEEAENQMGAGILTYYDASNTDLYQPCNWSAAEAQEAMATALSTNPMNGDNPIELVIANNDDMALGAIEALNEVGYNTGEGDFIPVVGVDATDAAQDAIAAGKMSGTILQDAEGMASAIVSLSATVAGGGELEDDLSSYNVDENAAKIRIPYAKYTG